MSTEENIHAFLQKATSSGSRSTALYPLAWLTGILISGLVLSAAFENKPEWVVILLASLLGLTVVLYLLGFIFFAIKNPDLLRSEKFNLSKLAIENNLIGDNISGLVNEDTSHRATDTPIHFIEEAQ